MCLQIKHWESFSLGSNGAHHRSVRWWRTERDLQLVGGELIKTKQLDQVLCCSFFLVWNDWTSSFKGVWDSVQSRSQTGEGVRPAGDDNTSSWVWGVRGETWKTAGVLHLHWRFELSQSYTYTYLTSTSSVILRRDPPIRKITVTWKK